MKNLVKALQILLKYGDNKNPFIFEYGIIKIVGYYPKNMSEQDISDLEKLGFIWENERECFSCYEHS